MKGIISQRNTSGRRSHEEKIMDEGDKVIARLLKLLPDDAREDAMVILENTVWHTPDRFFQKP